MSGGVVFDVSGFGRHSAALSGLRHDAWVAYRRVREAGGAVAPDEQALLFVHIPKCAGVSVRRALQLRYDGHRLLCDFPDERLESASKIVFCTRDPFDRTVSTYKYLQRLSQRRPLFYRLVGLPPLTTFSDFVHSRALERLEAYHYFFRSQYQYLRGIDSCSEKAVPLRFETVSEDFEREFGIALPRLNSDPDSLSEDRFDTDENRERVRRIYRVDYELLPKLIGREVGR